MGHVNCPSFHKRHDCRGAAHFEVELLFGRVSRHVEMRILAWTIPCFLLRDFTALGDGEAQDSEVENALVMAFENAHFDVLVYAAEKKWALPRVELCTYYIHGST